jgi:hypothetical protein
MWKHGIGALALLLFAGCGHDGNMAMEVGALEQEVEAYHHAVSAAQSVEAARSMMTRHDTAVREHLGRMHAMGMGMGMEGMASMCRGMEGEMEAHRRAMEQAADLEGMRFEAHRHREAMRGQIDALRQHMQGMGGMMMGGGH